MTISAPERPLPPIYVSVAEVTVVLRFGRADERRRPPFAVIACRKPSD
jgi:hypothetical protein